MHRASGATKSDPKALGNFAPENDLSQLHIPYMAVLRQRMIDGQSGDVLHMSVSRDSVTRSVRAAKYVKLKSKHPEKRSKWNEQ